MLNRFCLFLAACAVAATWTVGNAWAVDEPAVAGKIASNETIIRSSDLSGMNVYNRADTTLKLGSSGLERHGLTSSEMNRHANNERNPAICQGPRGAASFTAAPPPLQHNAAASTYSRPRFSRSTQCTPGKMAHAKAQRSKEQLF